MQRVPGAQRPTRPVGHEGAATLNGALEVFHGARAPSIPSGKTSSATCVLAGSPLPPRVLIPDADRSLRELTDMFGTSTAFGDWLAARKRISEIREKDLRNAERDGRLISRDLVRTHVFGALEGLSRRLLSDAPRTLAQRVCSLSRSGAPLEDMEAVIRDHMSSQIRPVKEKVTRALREGE